MTTIHTKTALSLLAAATLLGSLAGCQTATAGSGSSDTASGTANGDYTDGEYSAGGEYQSPNGQEMIDVTVTLADNVITDVAVTGEPSGPDATRYQQEFQDGIGAVVVGKNIDEIAVDKVAGSSLTSGGFNAAIEQIKAEAVA